MSAPGRNRTCDTRFRKPVLYPLSYEGPRAGAEDNVGENLLAVGILARRV